MKKKSLFLGVLGILITAVVLGAFFQAGEDLFQKALRLERNEGNLKEAIVLYQKVVTEAKDQSLAANAQLRIGYCYEKMGLMDAQKAFQKVIDNYPGQEKAVKEAEPVLLEPVMRLQVVVPQANFGAVQGNLLAKRGLITDCRVHGNMQVIDAKAPLVELFGYSSDIRSATAGRGTFTMEPLSYEKVPEQVAKHIVF